MGFKELISGIVLEGMKIWSTERRFAFEKKHSKVLKRVRDASNGYFPNYNDAELGLAEEEEEDFYRAYYQELKLHNQENSNV